MRRLSPLFVLSVAAVLLAGCAAPSDVTPQPAVDERTVSAMDPVRARSLIASSFPLEVPVAGGEVVSGKAQGEGAWDYQVVVDASPSAVANWYRRAYVGKSWVVVDERTERSTDGLERITITLRKGFAESEVVVTTDGGGARAGVILGVGTPVLQTQ